MDICRCCKSYMYITEDGLYTCSNDTCCYIETEVIDSSPEWNYFSQEEQDPSRCTYESSLSLCNDKNFVFNYSNGTKKNHDMRSIHRYTEWQSCPYKEKMMYKDIQRLTNITNDVGINKKLLNESIILYKKIISYPIKYRAENRDGLLSACLYYACRSMNTPRTLKEISSIFNFSVHFTTKGCKHIQLIYQKMHEPIPGYTSYETFGSLFIERFCSKLFMSKDMIQLCEKIVNFTDKNKLLDENTPPSIAVGVIYYVIQRYNLSIHKSILKNVSQVSEVTIIKCYKKLANNEKLNEYVLNLDNKIVN